MPPADQPSALETAFPPLATPASRRARPLSPCQEGGQRALRALREGAFTEFHEEIVTGRCR